VVQGNTFYPAQIAGDLAPPDGIMPDGSPLDTSGVTVDGLPGVSELRVQLRNDAAVAQSLPGLRLTLLDAVQRPVARRTLSAAEYLPGAMPDLAAGASVEARVPIEAPQAEAAGFQVDLEP